ncbi:hypothetical protein PN4B1_03240 [Paenibacillus naphthalenovorans]|nr:hypothetical protein PN4B1_03240 [Paenibacillus naphthalenovorans]
MNQAVKTFIMHLNLYYWFYVECRKIVLLSDGKRKTVVKSTIILDYEKTKKLHFWRNKQKNIKKRKKPEARRLRSID